MIYTLYLFFTIAINVVCIIVFNDSLNISGTSLVPILILVFMAIWSVYLYNNRSKDDFNINNYSDISEEEWGVVSVYISRSLKMFIPFNFPFICFFNAYVKAIAVVLIVMFAIMCGPYVYKIKNRRK